MKFKRVKWDNLRIRNNIMILNMCVLSSYVLFLFWLRITLTEALSLRKLGKMDRNSKCNRRKPELYIQ